MLIERLPPVEEIIRNPEKFFRENRPGFDHDGVICDTRRHVLGYVNDKLGTQYRDVDIRHWHAVTEWAILAGWTTTQARQLEDYVWYDPQFLSQADVNPGARELIDYLLYEDIRFDIITSRKPGLIGPTLSWYRKNFLIYRKNGLLYGLL